MRSVLPKTQVLIAAILFGASAPFSKLLLGNIDPIMLAALLYFGCGFGLLVLSTIQNAKLKTEKKKLDLLKKTFLG